MTRREGANGNQLPVRRSLSSGRPEADGQLGVRTLGTVLGGVRFFREWASEPQRGPLTQWADGPDCGSVAHPSPIRDTSLMGRRSRAKASGRRGHRTLWAL
jgi:hypothetical protein